MAKKSEHALEDMKRAEAMEWPALGTHWNEIITGTAWGWHKGKALEHLVIRGFKLSGLTADDPYDVPSEGTPIEQIDGLVFLEAIPFLIECKDTKIAANRTPISQLRDQLLHRPPITMGCFFATGGFTGPALAFADSCGSPRVTLWSRSDVKDGLESTDFGAVLRRK